MRIITLSYALPSDPVQLEAYELKAKGWTEDVLAEPNVTELRVYRSADGKKALSIMRIQSLADLDEVLASDKLRTLRSELEKAGCSNFNFGAWGNSPIMPEPIRREM